MSEILMERAPDAYLAPSAFSKRLIIFEGPDGGGKTTLSNSVAATLGARRTHLGPFSNVKHSLAQMYVEAMMPAVLGLSDVVLDRSWMSEVPYGRAFRAGRDRIGPEQRRMLTRLAYRCQVVVVRALPPFKTIVETFKRRRHQEMLNDEAQLRQVYDWYLDEWKPGLPTFAHDYTKGSDQFDRLMQNIDGMLSIQTPHPTFVPSAGPLDAPILLVGEGFAKHKDGDSLYQWPFGALSGGGCSRWLAHLMEEAGIPEGRLCWVNADAGVHCLHFLTKIERRAIIALGAEAKTMLDSMQVSSEDYHHPQYHRRFCSGEPYLLIERLKELTANV